MKTKFFYFIFCIFFVYHVTGTTRDVTCPVTLLRRKKYEEEMLDDYPQIIGKSYILTVGNKDSRTFLIFFVFSIVFPLELETRFYCLSVTTTTDSSSAQMHCI